MRRLAGTLAVMAVAVLLAAAGPADSPVNVPEPEGIWTGPQRGYTPTTLAGAVVLDIDGLDRLMAEKPVLLDVALEDVKPAGLASDKPWLPAHRSIPGSVWMPNAGAAPIDTSHEALFQARVEALTGGDRSRPVVAFCHPECWGSWNAAKRLVLEGYTRVHWFPDGIEGWQERHETAVIRPDPAWAAKTKSVTQR